MKAPVRYRLVLFLAVIAIAAIVLPAFAYQYPLSATDIRNAYLLGYAKDQETSDFFAQYVRQFPAPDSGPHVATITIKTPYAQVAELGKSAADADVQSAQDEFGNKNVPLLICVEVDLTATYPDPTSSNPATIGYLVPDFQHDFRIQLIQDGKEIEAQSTRVYLLPYGTSSNDTEISGAIIELKYDLDKVNPDEVTVKVHTPDDQHIKTDFDLGNLR
ncbi:MAG: hypothetical protein WAN14_19360 [Candidatus Acidiferrales bacterium]